MKYLQLLGTCLIALFALSHVSASAQSSVPVNEPDLNKPKLFSNLPDKIPVDVNTLQGLINSDNGKDISLRLGQDAMSNFDGKVISKTNDNNIQSVVIRSGNFNGATLSLSSSTKPDGAVKFTGRIISFRHGDMYELENQNNQYILIKKNFYDVINE